ncbi:MAG: type I-MYXAN CRISPR-associated protein Cas5/Cmx5/DevS [Proteobacteria bacterium]|nr:type I-MYXAN CRISPR-associated protein Cas5/Cmx5/DevS [Pseudomonadota bacterium]MBU4295157.1 type I-MYXAN CRISPR-associated protein Cas5/Cmx5/DevS [Pseudomonadota bacterium]MCG2749061.1 type I-MYXAN CRISPR-associated protein Cas5/Cmx5/DevS [Desulfobulbaceae bacterium]
MKATKDNGATLYLSVPVCSFRKGYAREYLETEEIPPPSTVYGFLLSLVGEEDRYRYRGTDLAYAVLSKPELSVILRTVWRMKDKKIPPGTGQNKRPDYQEILTGLEMAIWVKGGEFAERINAVGQNSAQTKRFGGLCLGESHDLINDILWNPNLSAKEGHWLVQDQEGEYPLPIWVDHVGSKNTVWKQFSLQHGNLELPAEKDPRWITIDNKQTGHTD